MEIYLPSHSAGYDIRAQNLDALVCEMRFPFPVGCYTDYRATHCAEHSDQRASAEAVSAS